MSKEYWAGIVTLLIGWCLKELGDRFRLRREERKPFAIAIADLLEMRHRILSVSTALGEIKKRLPIPPEAEIALKTFVDAILPQTEDLHRRYNEAVSLVAAVNPILAFRLRCKDEYLPLMQKLRPLLTADSLTRPFVGQVENTLSSVFTEDIEELITELAKAHGVATWLRIRRRLSKPASIPKEVDDLLRLIPKDQQPAPPAS